MGFQYRKFLEYRSLSESLLCSDSCNGSSDLGYCSGLQQCYNFCLEHCPFGIPPPPPSLFSPHHVSKLTKFVTSIIVVLAATFLLACCYGLYVRFYSRPRRSRLQEQEQRIENRDEFFDEDHGPMLDHPIWYINTIGLQPSVISSITVSKYKRGDGLVEGTECSVCLNEFQDNETLRLLPKCSHAFHIPCIDTWLRSHTNCPMCRAPIVTNTAIASSSGADIDNSTTQEEIQTQVGDLGNDRASDRELEGEDSEHRIGPEEEVESEVENRRKRCEELNEEEDGIQPLRRSVSLDSLSAFKISQALANVLPTESNQTSTNRQPVKQNGFGMGIVSKKETGNQSLLKFMAGSSIGTSLQAGPSSLTRSFSCSGKLFLLRYSRNRSRNSVLPS